MWVMSGIPVLLFVLTGTYNYLLALASDSPALAIAIILTCSRNQVDKTHGWIKLGLEISAGVVAFSVTHHT